MKAPRGRAFRRQGTDNTKIHLLEVKEEGRGKERGTGQHKYFRHPQSAKEKTGDQNQRAPVIKFTRTLTRTNWVCGTTDAVSYLF